MSPEYSSQNKKPGPRIFGMKQKTISQPFRLSGIGLHSGEESSLSFSPAPPNAGICFIKEGRRIPALVNFVRESKRGTSLDGIAVIEHFLSAVYGLGIDNLQVEITGRELPALDGSSLPYAQALESAGLVEQSELKNFLVLARPIKVIEGEASLEALPYRGFKVDFMIDFPGAGKQHYSFDPQKGAFEKEIAPARTFGYIEEYEMLKERGLALGASLENALVLGKDGYINTPRFPDELVRHKILDLMGDLALVGRPLLAEVKAIKSGHRLNIELTRLLRQLYSAGEQGGI
jgi:UDP-3-O-acyl N-acetylglucosamine deacetylase